MRNGSTTLPSECFTMIQKVGVLVVILCALCVFPNRSSAQDIRSVMVLGNEICLKLPNGVITHLTDGGVQKDLPVWSKDGTHIAFVEKTDDFVALAKLVVIDTNGRVISEVPIKPYSRGEVESGMRYVEALEWLTGDRIVVSGSVNPSTTEYDILDLASHKVIKQFFDDGKGAAFSLNGQHYAYVSGSPHFTPVDERVPSLNVDGNPVFSDTGDRLEFVDVPRWSEDSKSVAVLAATPETSEQNIIAWHLGETTASTFAIPFSSRASTSIFWSHSDLYVMGESSQPRIANKVWVLAGGAVPGSWAPAGAVDLPKAAAIARAHWQQLKMAVQKAGGKEPDFWCETCDLTVLPRRSGE